MGALESTSNQSTFIQASPNPATMEVPELRHAALVVRRLLRQRTTRLKCLQDKVCETEYVVKTSANKQSAVRTSFFGDMATRIASQILTSFLSKH